MKYSARAETALDAPNQSLTWKREALSNRDMTDGRRMRAARIVEPRTVAIELHPLPDPKPTEVRFRVEGSGVCASNLGPWFGLPWTQYPLAPGESGHEAWGVVDAVGKEVHSVREGDRIAAVSYRSFAEYDVAEERAVVPLPPALSGTPFPGEPLGCAMNIFERARIEAGQTVAVVGVGFLGALLTRLATTKRARVIAISRRSHSLDVAKRMGAAELVALDDHFAIIERVRELTGGAFCDRVIEATGKQWPLDLSAELTRTRGTLVIAGYHQDGARQVNMQLWNWRGLDVVNAHERDPEVYAAGIRAARDAVVSERIQPNALFTHQYPLEKLGEALEATSERPDGFMKALVMP